MAELQLPFPFYSTGFADLIADDNELVAFFHNLDPLPIDRVIRSYASPLGPQGYQRANYLAEVLRIKRNILSHRQLEQELRTIDLYRHLIGLNHRLPRHTTWSQFRKTLGIEGFLKIHAGYVLQAYRQGLLSPQIPTLPKRRREGLILIADSTFLQSVSANRVKHTEDGKTVYADSEATFGRKHHRYRYALGYRAHTLQTVNGIPLLSLVRPANILDHFVIVPLLDKFKELFPDFPVAYLILDKGYDHEQIHKTVYCDYGIVPAIIRKENIRYPKYFSERFLPQCKYRFELRRVCVDYERRRTHYQCDRVCLKSPDLVAARAAERCIYLKSKYTHGKTFYTHFKKGYRKYGPLPPATLMYRKLIKLRTAIERSFALKKENRYQMNHHLKVAGQEAVNIHATLYDTVAVLDALESARMAHSH